MLNIIDKKDCCGCSACVAICPKECIEMKEDSEGFLYPFIHSETCIKCGLCDKVCPVSNKQPSEPFEQEAYIVQNKDEQVLRESTAGGAFTAIAQYVINRNGIVFGVELGTDFVARHIYVESISDLGRFRNSKYIQSVVGHETFNTVKNFLEDGRYVCFSGTPCQIEGLKSYLKKDYPKLITVDVVCRAVPSPLIFKKYLEYQEYKMNQKILSVRFRDKYFGYKYSTMNIITDKNKGQYHKGVESDPWLRAFFSNICDRPSCHECRFRSPYRVSDFTIWDCFHVERFSTELDNDKGATRVLIHSERGKEIFKQIAKSFIFVKVTPELIIEGSKEMQYSPIAHKKREVFFDDANHIGGEQLFIKYFPNTFKVRLERTIRITCYKMGIYKIAKRMYIKLTGKY